MATFRLFPQSCGLLGFGLVAPGLLADLRVVYPGSACPEGEWFVSSAGERVDGGPEVFANLAIGSKPGDLPADLVDNPRAMAEVASERILAALEAFLGDPENSLTPEQLGWINEGVAATRRLPSAGPGRM